MNGEKFSLKKLSVNHINKKTVKHRDSKNEAKCSNNHRKR